MDPDGNEEERGMTRGGCECKRPGLVMCGQGEEEPGPSCEGVELV